jgi:hypothetical protein
MKPTVCPYCNRPAAASETLVPGRVILSCRPCAVFKVVGDADWNALSPTALQAVRDTIAKADKEAAQRQTQSRQRQEEERQQSARALLGRIEWVEQK